MIGTQAQGIGRVKRSWTMGTALPGGAVGGYAFFVASPPVRERL
jgi:hypothetical protein